MLVNEITRGLASSHFSSQMPNDWASFAAQASQLSHLVDQAATCLNAEAAISDRLTKRAFLSRAVFWKINYLGKKHFFGRRKYSWKVKRGKEKKWERMKERERYSAYVGLGFVCPRNTEIVREREKVCVAWCMSVWYECVNCCQKEIHTERERHRLCVCMCLTYIMCVCCFVWVCVWEVEKEVEMERERKRERNSLWVSDDPTNVFIAQWLICFVERVESEWIRRGEKTKEKKHSC